MTATTTRLERIYRDTFKASDFAVLKPNQLLVSPVQPPAMLGGLHMPGSSVVGANALLYRVEAAGVCRAAELSVFGPLCDGLATVFAGTDAVDDVIAEYGPGDVLLVRNGMLEPVDPRGSLLVIDVRHVLGKLAPLGADEPAGD